MRNEIYFNTFRNILCNVLLSGRRDNLRANCLLPKKPGLIQRHMPSRCNKAADYSVIPYGSIVFVEGYGYAIVLDCGGDIKGKRIDVWFPEYNTCKNCTKK